ncbi:MAG: hypothetical protein H0T11_04515, partial [Chthoniobacterales bacterium]|nr:hypothetical protein [Chthoniobacterales bacterium]
MESSAIGGGRLTRRAKLVCWCAIVLPVVLGLWMMVQHWVAVPYWDEWKTPGEQIASYYRGSLTWAELCSQHNESRKLFPRLVYLPLAVIVGWDVRWVMAVSFAFVCGGSLLLYALARRTCASPRAALFCYVSVNAWLFWPRQYENFLVGIQGELFVPAFALAGACLVNLSRRPLWQKSLVNAVLAHVSTYSVANGMLIWLLAFPVRTLPAKTRGTRDGAWRVAYCAAAVASVFCYFHGYEHAALSPQMVVTVGRWPELAHFLARWLGDITLLPYPAIAGAAVLLLFVTFAMKAALLVRHTGEWQPHYPWIVLGVYTVISGCITAAGRLEFGLHAAAHFRYAPFTAFLYIAVVGLIATTSSRLPIGALAKRISLTTLAGLWCFALLQEQPHLDELTTHRSYVQRIVRWADAIPNNPQLASVSPYETTLATIRTLAAKDVLRPRLVSEILVQPVKQPPLPRDDPAGVLEHVDADLVAKGWARIPDQQRPADCVLLGYEDTNAE